MTPVRPSSAPWVLAATILGSSLVFIDGAVVSIALPVLQRDLSASSALAQWVVESYTLVLGALMLLGGALGDRYGRKRVFVLGVAVFAIGSVLCGLAPSMPLLIGARVIAGLGGILLAPGSLALIGACFEGAARGKAVGTWSGLTAVASAIGPVAGGAIVDHWGWRWVFFINVPIAIAVIAIALVHVPESIDPGERNARLDVTGSLLATLGLGGVVYGFVGAGSGWNAIDAAILVAGCIALVAFIVVERTASNPILPLGLFANRTFSGVNLMTFFLYGALSGLFYYLPFVMIQVDGYDATVTGFSLLPFILLMVALSRWAGALAYRLGARTLLIAGPAVAALGFAALGLLPDLHYWTGIFPAVLLIGAGMGLTVAPLTATMIESVPEHNVGLASGINNAVSRVAGLLAIAVLGAMLGLAYGARLDRRMATSNFSASQRLQIQSQRDAMAGAILPNASEKAAVDAAYLDGFRAVAIACALLAALSAATSAATISNIDRTSPRSA